MNKYKDDLVDKLYHERYCRQISFHLHQKCAIYGKGEVTMDPKKIFYTVFVRVKFNLVKSKVFLSILAFDHFQVLITISPSIFSAISSNFWCIFLENTYSNVRRLKKLIVIAVLKRLIVIIPWFEPRMIARRNDFVSIR